MRNTEAEAGTLQVAVAVILNAKHEVLVARRPEDKHLGGMLEFPGGKIEAGETPVDALRREIKEEVNLDVYAETFLQSIYFEYDKHPVNLQVYLCEQFSQTEKPLENQQLYWLPVASLRLAEFPPANKAIIHRLQLPDQYMITGAAESQQIYLDRCMKALDRGVKLIQLRTRLDSQDFLALARELEKQCRKHAAQLLLNTSVEISESFESAGLHLNSHRLYQYSQRPVSRDRLLSTSCHNVADIEQAELIEADLVLLSPVKSTSSHPDAMPMGWQQFEELTRATSIPVYALGGMQLSDIDTALTCGAQGVAGISSYWP